MIPRCKSLPCIVYVLVCVASLLPAQTGKRVWVLKEPNEIVEYDPATWAMRQSVKAPSEALKNPQALVINCKGQMLFAPNFANGEKVTALVAPNSEQKLWFWNGQATATVGRGATRKAVPAGPDVSVTETIPLPFLSADGDHLFWFANETRTLQRENVELSVTTTFRAWRTDLAGGRVEELATYAFPECRCDTGVCSETCPEASFWFPDGGVDNFFIATHWIPGQIGSEYQASFLYQKSQGKWSEKKFPHAIERILDAAENGGTVIEAMPDSGCCGWDNESNDETLLTRNGKTVVLFDERARYKNPNYDVSFFTSKGSLSPDLSAVAMTITSTAQPGEAVRLSADGQADPEELARIRKALADLPAVEIVSATDPPKRAALLPHATLVGWVNDKEVLIVEDHVLVAFNVATGNRRKSEIKVPDDSQVFLR